MPKQRVVSPGVGGAIDDAVYAVKSFVGAGRRNITSGDEQDQLDELDKPEGSHSSDQASNAGKQAQSTDHMNP
jgi:hypothetical protein